MAARWQAVATSVVLAVAVIGAAVAVTRVDSWLADWQIVPYLIAVVVVAWLAVSARIPHTRDWGRVGAIAFAFAAYLAFGVVAALAVIAVHVAAVLAFDAIRDGLRPLVGYGARSGRVMLGILAGGSAASLATGHAFGTPGDHDLAALPPFAACFLLVQVVVIFVLYLRGIPGWERRSPGRLSSLGLPPIVQVVVWEAFGVVLATTIALIVDTVGLRLDYWVACLIALATLVWVYRALDQNILLAERNRELARAMSELRTLNELNRVLSAVIEPARVYEVLAAELRRLLAADAVVIARIEPVQGRVRLAWVEYGGVRQPERFAPLVDETRAGSGPGGAPDDHGDDAIVRRVLESRSPVQGTDTESFPLVRSDGTLLPAERAGVRHFHSAAGAPMLVGGDFIGVLAVKSHQPDLYDVPRVDLLVRVANLAAVAIRNAEVLAEERAANVARRDFLSAVSHELRTPITSISGYAQLLARRLATDAAPGATASSSDGGAEAAGSSVADGRQRMAAVIVDQSRHLGRMVDDLVTLSGLGQGDGRRAEVPVDLVEVARAATAAARLGLPDPACLELDADGRLHVLGDPVRLRQVFDHLIENAVTYAPPRSPVVVRVAEIGGAVEVRVHNEGQAIASTDQARVFEPFFRIEPTPSDERGTPRGLGLGLSIVREIVVAHGGDITVTSEPGRGTTFVIRLLRAEDPRPPATATHLVETSVVGARDDGRDSVSDSQPPASGSHPGGVDESPPGR